METETEQHTRELYICKDIDATTAITIARTVRAASAHVSLTIYPHEEGQVEHYSLHGPALYYPHETTGCRAQLTVAPSRHLQPAHQEALLNTLESILT